MFDFQGASAVFFWWTVPTQKNHQELVDPIPNRGFNMFQPFMDFYDGLGFYGFYGFLWISMDFPWVSMGFYGFLWIFHGFLWVYMGFYGFRN